MNIPVARLKTRHTISNLLNEITVLKEAAKEKNALANLVGQLREANQNLVLATLNAQAMKDDADLALSALEQARKEIEVGLARYTELYDFAPSGYFTLERDGTLDRVNLTGAALLGWPREKLTGQQLKSFVAIKFKNIFHKFLENVFMENIKHSCEVMLLRSDGIYFYARIEAIADTANLTCRVALEDITQRKSAENALSIAHEDLEIRVLERTEDLEKAVEQLHLEMEERNRVQEALQTSRKKLRMLVRHQEQVKESERMRIARDIHDDLGQNLLALKIDITMLHTRTGGTHPNLSQRAAASLSHIDAMMKSVKAIINNLRPSVLDLGLYAAVEWQANEFQKRTGIACSLAAEEKDFDAYVDSETATGLFRVVQESLSNVHRHAQATHVSISLHRNVGSLNVKVTDNGIGIHPNCRRKANSFGLIGMQERILMLGGTLSIGSGNEGVGTVLNVSIPIRDINPIDMQAIK
ncbi:MAG: histidine kinase [Burkholderiaceae bacterium]